MRYLIINVTRIGDTLFATPAIRAIAENDPNAIIDVLAHPNRYEVLQNLPFINKVGKITKNIAKFLKYFAKKQYDYAIVYGFDKELVRYALKVAEKVVAFNQSDEIINKKLYRTVEVPGFQCEHAVLQFLRLSAAIGCHTSNFRLNYKVKEQEVQSASDTIKNIGVSDTDILIGLQISGFRTRSSCGDWSSENFIDLCKSILNAKKNVKFVIFGSNDDDEKASIIVSALPEKSICSFAGKLSLRQSAAIMSLLNLYIGVDTGPTHIASTFDYPIVVLFPANSPSFASGPLQHPMSYLIDHPLGHILDSSISMNDILVEDVFAEIKKVFGI